MEINTTRFGVIEVDDSSIVRMPQGPLGFEEEREFFLMQHRDDSRFRWLQSTTEPGLAFVVVDPSQFFANYEIEISDADAEKLQLTSDEDALVLSIVTIDRETKDVTANLAAPVIINAKSLIGMQVVLQDDRYRVKELLALPVETSSTQKATAKAA